MRKLLDSGWMKFGPAGRGSLDWVPGTGPSPLPSLDKLAQGDQWDESSSEEKFSKEFILYTVVASTSFLLISLVGLLVYRRCSTSKMALTNVITLDLEELQDLQDLQDPESSTDFLSSLAFHRDKIPSCSSDTDTSDGVFLMVYLPTPYEETLTTLARAASVRSSKSVDRSASVRSCRGVDRAGSTRTSSGLDQAGSTRTSSGLDQAGSTRTSSGLDQAGSTRTSSGLDRAGSTRTSSGLDRAATVRNSRDVDSPKIERSASARIYGGAAQSANNASTRGLDPPRPGQRKKPEEPVEQTKD